jgi:UDP-N-acetyl-D-glucosamine dehydrogenase
VQKKEIIALIGLGYVGLPLLIDFCEAGFNTIGIDIDEQKIEKLNAGSSYISYIPSAIIAKYSENGSLKASSDFSELKNADTVIITVPTPLNDHREPDLGYVISTVEMIAGFLRKGHLIILESTTYPGTTREEVLPILENTGLKAGIDFNLAYSPERVDPSNSEYSSRKIPKVVGGITDSCLARAVSLYEKVFEQVVPVSSTDVAESSKLLENIFRSVNIAMVNELKMLFDLMGIDIWEVLRASSTKPFGFMPFYPGPGLGGHCIPIDPFYLTWKAREYDFSTRFIELAGEINSQMPYYVVRKTIDALNERGKSIKGAQVLILGAAYKKDIDDIRESPAVKIIQILKDKGAKISYHDPYIPAIDGMRRYPGFKMESIILDKQSLQAQDCLVVITEHGCFDYEMILENSKLIIDTRNIFSRFDSNQVVKA